MAMTEAGLREEHGGWLGSNPYYLLIVLASGRHAEVDLDQSGWLKWFREYLRAPGQWYLVRKTDRLILATMLVHEGEQPYYVAKHVGFTVVSDDPNGPRGETTSYGIGKKRLDGHVDRIWIMANGCVTLGDDVEPISLSLLRSGML